MPLCTASAFSRIYIYIEESPCHWWSIIEKLHFDIKEKHFIIALSHSVDFNRYILIIKSRKKVFKDNIGILL